MGTSNHDIEAKTDKDHKMRLEECYLILGLFVLSFGKEKKSSYYKKCIDAAALKTDLEILPSGDQVGVH